MTGRRRKPSRAAGAALLLVALWFVTPAHAAVEVDVAGQQLDVAQHTLNDAGWKNVELNPAELAASADRSLVIVVKQTAIVDGIDGTGTTGYRLDLGAVVPDVVDQSLPAAEQLLLASGLRTRASSGNDDPRDLLVVNQSRDPGTRVPIGTTVALKLVRGAHVPALVGKSVPDAQAAIDAAGLQLEVDRKGKEGTLGKVEDQDPEADTLVAADSTVTVAVSVIVVPPGTRSTTVPNLAGLHVGESRQQLRDARLTLTPTVVGDVNVALSVRQDPPPGTKVLRGSPVAVRFEVPVPAGSSGSSWPWVLGGGVALAGAATLLRRPVRARRERAWVEHNLTFEGDVGRAVDTRVERPDADICWSVRLEPHLDPGSQSMEEVSR